MIVRSTAVAVAGCVLVLIVCAAAYAENYTFKRTTAGDAIAGSRTLRKTDFPVQFRLTGGRVKPDETPNNDTCNGYLPKEHDLIVAGDAESRFHDSAHSVVVDSQVVLFKSTAMAATDVQRGKRMISPACQAQAAEQEHVKLVSYALLGRPRCSCEFAVTATFEAKTAHANLHTLTIVTALRKGRFEATIVTNVGKSTTDPQSGSLAASTALVVQGLAVKSILTRLDAV